MGNKCIVNIKTNVLKNFDDSFSFLVYLSNLKWSVLKYVPPYSNISKKCLLRLYEKLEIITYQNQKELLNKRSQLLCKCRHVNKFLLKNYTSNGFR